MEGGSDFFPTPPSMARIRVSPRLAGFVISSAMKLLSATWRWRMEDRGGWMGRAQPGAPVIWLCWHNRIFMAPLVYWKWFRKQPAGVLTSASKDGDVLAETCRHFTLEAARGSSSRRGAAALRECLSFLKANRDICVTPDGPRGPRYVMQPGVVLLAERSGVPILPLHLNPRRAWRLKTWDGFLIPWPFTRIDVVLDEGWVLEKSASPEAFEAQRAKLEAMLRAGARDPAPATRS